MPTAVVTDSTANIPAELSSIAHVRVVPMTVVIGGHPYEEGVDVTSADIVAALRAGEEVTTAHPGPGAFLAAYREVAAGGADAIVSAHVSSRLSGACNSARLAAAESSVPVTVVDSQAICMALGFAALEGAHSAADGASPDDVARMVTDVARRSRLWFCVDDLEYLRRGGRIGAARALLGRTLAIKPILSLSAGEVVPFDRVRTTAKAVARLEELAVEQALSTPSQIAVHHLDVAERADELAERLRQRLPGTPVQVSEVAAVISAHSGPGAIAVAVAPTQPAAVGEAGP